MRKRLLASLAVAFGTITWLPATSPPNVRGKLANGYIHGIDRVLIPVDL
jgi:hypothetical protein